MSYIDAIKKVDRYNWLKARLDLLNEDIKEIYISIKRYKKDVVEEVNIVLYLDNNQYLKTSIGRKKYIGVLTSILKEKNKELLSVQNELENL